MQRPRRIGDGWCNRHQRYEIVYADNYIPGTNIPHDPHHQSSTNYQLKARDAAQCRVPKAV